MNGGVTEGVRVMVVAGLVFPAMTVSELGLGERVKLPKLADQALKRALASTEPRPATRL